jgi:hypothetical protein
MIQKKEKSMSSFCTECSEKLFGRDFGDFSGIAEEGQIAHVLCEGCGFIWVDPTGKKIEPVLTTHKDEKMEKKTLILKNSHEIVITKESQSGVFLNGVLFPGWSNIDNFIEHMRPILEAINIPIVEEK